MIKINGQEFHFADSKSISKVFLENNIETPKGIAVALNNKVIPRLKWDEQLVQQSDNILIIKATQGG
ncbi:MAG: sulfur carrier protein ThiS [Bacteroidetes bacterium]|nr:sulfur carrier protein ThiS [Bacteroidota bacterium]